VAGEAGVTVSEAVFFSNATVRRRTGMIADRCSGTAAHGTGGGGGGLTVKGCGGGSAVEPPRARPAKQAGPVVYFRKAPTFARPPAGAGPLRRAPVCRSRKFPPVVPLSGSRRKAEERESRDGGA